MAGLVAKGIRGVTSNPTILAKAIAGQDTYDAQFGTLIKTKSVEDAYWDLVIHDIDGALAILRPVYDSSGRSDGFVSVEVAPALAHDTDGHHQGGPRPPPAHQPAQRPGQDPRHPGGRPRHPPDDQRGTQHQCHPHLQHRPLRRSHRGLPVRARGPGGLGNRGPLPRGQRGLLLHQPGRHRGGPSPRVGRFLPSEERRAPRAAGEGGGGPGTAGLQAVPDPVHRAPLGGPGRTRVPGSSVRCGRRRRPRTPTIRTCSTWTR